jgi:integrase
MTKVLQMKYLKFDPRGQYRYRRRVPKNLVKALGKREFIKVLARDEDEAFLEYPKYHKFVERLISGTHQNATSLDPKAIMETVHTVLSQAGFDLSSKRKTEDELIARDVLADQIFSKYVINDETGHPDPEDMKPLDRAMASALLNGIQSVEIPCTVEAAFDFYLNERQVPDEYKRKKQIQRLGRVKNALLAVIKNDLPLQEVNRRHAREIRDHLLKDKSPATVKRMFNDLKAVFNLATLEFEIVMPNPFERMELPAQQQRIDQRLPLPADLISVMYEELQSNSDLLDIWTIIHHTGAQTAEILGLQGTDIVISDAVPHLVIRPNDLRGVKAAVRERKVPLLGRALEAAQRRLANIDNKTDPIFPKYAAVERHDSFSASINKRLRKHTAEKKHVCYGLRHNMKDSLIEVGATQRQQDAILGHSMGTRASEGYGSRPKLAELEDIMKRIDFGRTHA